MELYRDFGTKSYNETNRCTKAFGDREETFCIGQPPEPDTRIKQEMPPNFAVHPARVLWIDYFLRLPRRQPPRLLPSSESLRGSFALILKQCEDPLEKTYSFAVSKQTNKHGDSVN